MMIDVGTARWISSADTGVIGGNVPSFGHTDQSDTNGWEFDGKNVLPVFGNGGDFCSFVSSTV